MKTILPVVSLAALFLIGCTATAPRTPLARVSGGGPEIAFSAGRRSWPVELPANIRRVPPDDGVQLIDYRSIDGVDYLLLAVDGTSMGRNAAGHECGGGDETSLVWLRYRAGRLHSVQQRLVRSCARDIELLHQGWFADEYRAELLEVKDGRHYRTVVTYDLRRIDAGLRSATRLDE